MFSELSGFLFNLDVLAKNWVYSVVCHSLEEITVSLDSSLHGNISQQNIIVAMCFRGTFIKNVAQSNSGVQEHEILNHNCQFSLLLTIMSQSVHSWLAILNLPTSECQISVVTNLPPFVHPVDNLKIASLMFL